MVKTPQDRANAAKQLYPVQCAGGVAMDTSVPPYKCQPSHLCSTPATCVLVAQCTMIHDVPCEAICHVIWVATCSQQQLFDDDTCHYLGFACPLRCNISNNWDAYLWQGLSQKLSS
jgi:hypothetical protein